MCVSMPCGNNEGNEKAKVDFLFIALVNEATNKLGSKSLVVVPHAPAQEVAIFPQEFSREALLEEKKNHNLSEDTVFCSPFKGTTQASVVPTATLSFSF